jgi:hypothetical protein
MTYLLPENLKGALIAYFQEQPWRVANPFLGAIQQLEEKEEEK